MQKYETDKSKLQKSGALSHEANSFAFAVFQFY